ncbi:cell wall metabolism sensor histidine kinase WalK [Ammoniphilus sp. CFH 90114]|uniref:sensor histidine kinase n=1 Tax=Ammoniphilus sp. CFH 90114 TaxID=2493665 RepID=UPI00100DDA79|nr:HAMP domain-containing sensor histidine kinase [Ammoniphilus sp. CFH 90114]RXT13921.1 HAMP domain-containing histidine kinase [Ammoniphilus sp. CFH 90114]
MPIRLKLSLWYSGVFLLVITLFCTYIYLFFTHREMNQIDFHLRERAQEVHQSIEIVDVFPLPLRRLVLPDINVFSSPELFLQIVDMQGRVISRSESLGEYSLPISTEALNHIVRGTPFFETKNVQGTQIRLYHLPLVSGKQFIGVLQVAESLYGFHRSLSNLRWLLAIGALTTVTLSALLGWILARQALLPIHRIIETTAEIEREGKLERRINYPGPPDEIGQLSTQINSMMEKIEQMYRELEESYEAQRRFVADASHELRTPLTTIRGNMDFLRKLYKEKGVLSEEAMEDIVDELERVSRMVHDLLALARADAGYHIQMEDIKLTEWLEDWIHKGKGLAKPDVLFHHEETPEELKQIKIKGNLDFLKQISLILLENAFKYTSSGKVELRCSLKNQGVIIEVIDTGSGIPEEEVHRVFDRFYRGGNVRNRPGTGLGLSIAKWIIEKHGGTILVESELGKGTKVLVTLPYSKNTP